MSCFGGFYSDDSDNLFRCVPCRSAPAWVIIASLLALLAVAAVFLKLNSTPWFERVTAPARIGFVYISVVSMLNLVRLQWPGGLLAVLSGLQLSLFKLDAFQSTACLLSF
jgi:hypothetical protein